MGFRGPSDAPYRQVVCMRVLRTCAGIRRAFSPASKPSCSAASFSSVAYARSLPSSFHLQATMTRRECAPDACNDRPFHGGRGDRDKGSWAPEAASTSPYLRARASWNRPKPEHDRLDGLVALWFGWRRNWFSKLRRTLCTGLFTRRGQSSLYPGQLVRHQVQTSRQLSSWASQTHTRDN